MTEETNVINETKASSSESEGEKESKTAIPVVQPTDDKATVTIESTPSVAAEVTITRVPEQKCPEPPCPESPKWWQTALLGSYLLLVFLVLGYLLLKLWVKRGPEEIWLFWGIFRRQIQDESRLLGIVMVAGALGGFLHAAKSFSAYVGNQRIYINWFWWYIVRPFSGMVLATLFYFLVRGGLLTGQTTADQVSDFGMAAVAGLAGMFADRAALKLEEVFANLFKTDDARKDKLGGSEDATGKRKPTISSISKAEIKTGTATDITITGTSFDEKATVTLAGKPVKKATVISATEIKVELSASEIPLPGSYDLIVINPAPAGPSDPVKVKVVA
jgi:hypothetical protein